MAASIEIGHAKAHRIRIDIGFHGYPHDQYAANQAYAGKSVRPVVVGIVSAISFLANC
jgi:hypothetical protein